MTGSWLQGRQLYPQIYHHVPELNLGSHYVYLMLFRNTEYRPVLWDESYTEWTMIVKQK